MERLARHRALQVTVSADTHGKLRRAQDLLRHVVPNGDPAVILDRALTLLVRELERQKFALRTGEAGTETHASQPRPGSERGPAERGHSRHIPAAVRREVWARDEGRCAFVGASGTRCGERGFLEFHHEVPFAAGGDASASNISLMCKQHNGHEAERFFGEDVLRRALNRRSVRTESGARAGPPIDTNSVQTE